MKEKIKKIDWNELTGVKEERKTKTCSTPVQAETGNISKKKRRKEEKKRRNPFIVQANKYVKG